MEHILEKIRAKQKSEFKYGIEQNDIKDIKDYLEYLLARNQQGLHINFSSQVAENIITLKDSLTEEMDQELTAYIFTASQEGLFSSLSPELQNQITGNVSAHSKRGREITNNSVHSQPPQSRPTINSKNNLTPQKLAEFRYDETDLYQLDKASQDFLSFLEEASQIDGSPLEEIADDIAVGNRRFIIGDQEFLFGQDSANAQGKLGVFETNSQNYNLDISGENLDQKKLEITEKISASLCEKLISGKNSNLYSFDNERISFLFADNKIYRSEFYENKRAHKTMQVEDMFEVVEELKHLASQNQFQSFEPDHNNNENLEPNTKVEQPISVNNLRGMYKTQEGNETQI